MKYSIVVIIIVSVSFLTGGCASQTYILQNKHGQVVTCRKSTLAKIAIGVVGTDYLLSECLQKYQAMGYVITPDHP